MIWFQLYIFLHLLILIFLLPTNRDCGRLKQDLFDILIFIHLQKNYLKNLVELPIYTTFDDKLSRSTGHEWNLKK